MKGESTMSENNVQIVANATVKIVKTIVHGFVLVALLRGGIQFNLHRPCDNETKQGDEIETEEN